MSRARNSKPARDLPVIPYIRVSRIGGREGESFISVKVQQQRIKQYADAHNLQLTDWFIDPDRSGKNTSRPAFQEALAEIRAQRAAGICVLKLDRFARSVIDAVKTANDIKKDGGRFISVSEDIDLGTPVGELQFHIFAALAQFELARITESWHNTLEEVVMQRGVHVSRHTPFGYIRKPDEPRKGMLLPDPDTANVVSELFDRRAAGESWGDLVKWLNSTPYRIEKLASKKKGWVRSKDWAKTTLQAMVANRVYLGEAHAAGTDDEIPEDRRLDFVNEDAHEALTDPETWDAAQQTIGRSGRSGEIAGEALCRGILKCGVCENTLVVTGSKQKDPDTGEYRRMPFYYCRGSYASGDCPQPVSISASKIDPWVDEHFRTHVVRPVHAQADEASSQLPQLQKTLDRAERALSDLYDHMSETIEDFGEGEYQRRRRKILSERDAAKAAVEEERLKASMRGRLVTGELLADWPNMTPAAKNDHLRLIYESIAIAPTDGRARGRWAPPADRRVLRVELTDL